MSLKSVAGNIVDVLNKNIFFGTVNITHSKIVSIEKKSSENKNEKYILPGLIDAHIHIESSMLTPYEFSRIALQHGTVATISDPHEIANVLGLEGVRYMINNAKHSPLKFFFGAPSCVPATNYETAGATLTVHDIEELFRNDGLLYLAEMMNYPGVLNESKMVMEKIGIAKKYHRLIDGHAPGLRGEEARRYIEAGITTDHECFTKEEALDKLKCGMKILIREGSAAKNFDALISLVSEYPDKCMFCSDDKHPDDLEVGHINELVKRAFRLGLDKMKVLQCACVNPVQHYELNVGLLQAGDDADFIVVDNLEDFNILQTCIKGEVVAENGKTFLPDKTFAAINNFSTHSKKENDFHVKAEGSHIRAIVALDGQLITERIIVEAKIENGLVMSDVENDVLKVVVVNRYSNEKPAVGFIKNVGLKEGAIASSVAHDSHNIVAVGVRDEEICRAVNLIIERSGGLCAVNSFEEKILPLPIAGLISNEKYQVVSQQYEVLDKAAKTMGSKLRAPFMTLSFMALLVIPKFKISDLGIFDAVKFDFVELFSD